MSRLSSADFKRLSFSELNLIWHPWHMFLSGTGSGWFSLLRDKRRGVPVLAAWLGGASSLDSDSSSSSTSSPSVTVLCYKPAYLIPTHWNLWHYLPTNWHKLLVQRGEEQLSKLAITVLCIADSNNSLSSNIDWWILSVENCCSIFLIRTRNPRLKWVKLS